MTENKYLEMPWGIEDTIENLKTIKEHFIATVLKANLDDKGKQDAREVEFDFNRAIKALEEIQQYRAIGTVEDIADGIKQSEEEFNMLMEYLNIGTIDEFKALKEKSVAKKPIRNDLRTCPSCGTFNEVIEKRRNTVAFDTVYCWHCGQAIEIKRN